MQKHWPSISTDFGFLNSTVVNSVKDILSNSFATTNNPNTFNCNNNFNNNFNNNNNNCNSNFNNFNNVNYNVNSVNTVNNFNCNYNNYNNNNNNFNNTNNSNNYNNNNFNYNNFNNNNVNFIPVNNNFNYSYNNNNFNNTNVIPDSNHYNNNNNNNNSNNNIKCSDLSIEYDMHKKCVVVCLKENLICKKYFQIILQIVLNHFKLNSFSVTIPNDIFFLNIYNPRELIFCLSTTPFKGIKNRTNAITLICYKFIWELDVTIYGGYVRDFIINNEYANDVDLMLPQSYSFNNACNLIQQLIFECSSFTSYKLIKTTKLVNTVEVRGNWHGPSITIDIKNATNNVTLPSPGVECTASNLILTKNGVQLYKQIPNYSLDLCKDHCRKKQFIWLYDFNSNPLMCQTRIKKYLKRNWTCLSLLPEPYYSQLRQLYPQNFNTYC